MLRWLSMKALVLISLLGLSLGIYYLVTAKKSHSNNVSYKVEVSAAPVIERIVQEWSEFSGRLSAIEEVQVRPQISGPIAAIHFKSGEIVKKDDLLFTIDPRPYIAEVARAQGAEASAKARLKFAQDELLRAKKLIRDKAISQSDYDNRENNFNVEQANYESAKAALNLAKINLGYTSISSPINGKISRAEITVGNLVEVGMPVLTTVVSTASLYGDFEVDESTFLRYVQAEDKKVNQIQVKMGLVTEEGTPRQGRIESFDNRLNSASGTIRVRAIFDNDDEKLIPGLFARINLGNGAKAKALLVTDRAIGTDQNKKFVLVVGEDNKVKYREIKLGTVVEGLRIVKSGLQAGEKIIVKGLQHVRPEQEVSVNLVSMDTQESAEPKGIS